MKKMSTEQFAIELKALAERIDVCQQVTRYDVDGEKQAWTLAHSFLDLEESFRVFLEEQLPRLRDERLSCEEIEEVLLEIGEEFRHILYHVETPKFYAYLRTSQPTGTLGDGDA